MLGAMPTMYFVTNKLSIGKLMLYLIILTFTVIYIFCAVLSEKILQAAGESEVYWFFLFLFFG